MTLNEIIAALDLQPHPEGGHYRETFRDTHEVNGRSSGTAIYYALGIGDCSAWHKVDAAEIWHWYAGAPLALTLSPNGHDAEAHRLGSRLEQGERPQIVVPAGWWQTAESLGEWTWSAARLRRAFPSMDLRWHHRTGGRRQGPNRSSITG